MRLLTTAGYRGPLVHVGIEGHRRVGASLRDRPRRGRSLLDRAFPEGKVDIDGDGEADGCANSDADKAVQGESRTDVEGCCWWGRGAIQTTGVCNFGKLNYFLGKKAKARGREALFPEVDF